MIRADRLAKKRAAEEARYAREMKRRTAWRDRILEDPGYFSDQRKATEEYVYALRHGLLKKPKTCSLCGDSGKIHGHHPDYKKPLDVVWLCATCHMREHARIRKERAA